LEWTALQNQTKAYLMTMVAVICWGTAASAFKLALQYVSPYILLVYSVLVSTIALFVILLAQAKLSALKNVSRQQLGKCALLGLINPFLFYTVIFKAYALLPGQIAMSINFGWPLVLTLLSVPILKQQLTKAQLFAVVISFVGAIIIATKGQFTGFGDVSRLGLILVSGSTVIWSTFWLLNARDGSDPVIKLFLGFCFGLCYALIFSPFFGGLLVPELKAFGPLVYIGLFEMGITFVLWLTALQLSSTAARVSNLIYISPFLSLVFLRLVIGEQIHPATFIGLFLIVGSILFQEMQANKIKA
jgi:drug/metabolite transporter (DMT)-like permease